MGVHFNGNGRELGKKGLTVEVKQSSDREAQARNLENAIRLLKRRMVQEGVVRDMRKKEYFESKGTLRRKAKAEAVRRQKKRDRAQPL